MAVLTPEQIQEISAAVSAGGGEGFPGEFESGIPFFGPAFGPLGDVSLSNTELDELRKFGIFRQRGQFADIPGSRADLGQSGDIFGTRTNLRQLGIGGGRGGAGPAPTFGVGRLESSSPEVLRDKLIGLYEQWTGAFPDRPSLDFVTNQALGNKPLFDIRASVQATPEFRTRFKHMPAGMDVAEYDQALVQANASALDIAGRPVNDVEIEKWFAGDGNGFYDSLKNVKPLPVVAVETLEEDLG